MNRMRMTLTVVALIATLLGSTLPVGAQESVDPAVRAELAAIVLDASDLPVGYSFTGESFLTADQLGTAGFDATALTDAGFITMYVSLYENSDTGTRIRSYVSAWSDEQAAGSGFILLENLSLVPDGALTDGAIEVGEEPRELTTGTYPEGDATIGTADATFRSGNLIVGVATETMDGSEADTELATSLANRIAERATAVHAGEAPANTDLTLPASVATIADQGELMQSGFLGPKEVETIYGVQGSVLSSIQTSWIDVVALGDNGNPPVVTLGLSTFANEDDAAGAVNQSAEIFAPLTNQQPVDGVTVDGSQTVAAYQYSSASAQDNALDSYRLLFSVGQNLVVIDIQGASSDTAAADLATQLAQVQVACQGGGECTAPDLSAGLAG